MYVDALLLGVNPEDLRSRLPAVAPNGRSDSGERRGPKAAEFLEHDMAQQQKGAMHSDHTRAPWP